MNVMANTEPEAEITATVSENDLAEAVRSTALLADLTVSMWGAEKTDHKIMDEAKVAHGATGNVGRAIKNLMAGKDSELKDVRAAYNQARVLHAQLTLPYITNPQASVQSGPRLLPNMLFNRYAKEMGRLKRAAEAKLEAFLVNYPQLSLEAQANLGGLANPQDYPSVEGVRAAFNLAFDFQPIPAHNAFVGLPDGMLAKLGARLREKQEAAAQASQKAMWERVQGSIQHLVDRIADPEVKFKSVTVENVRELITLLPGFNVTGDQRVQEIVLDIERMLTRGANENGAILVTAESIKKDEAVRSDVVTKARAIADKLSGWGL